MGIKNSFKQLTSTALCCLFATTGYAANVSMNTAQMQALDKITGQMKIIEVPVNGEVKFGSFSIVARECQTTPPEEVPENYAFIDIVDTNKEGKIFNIFKGWMVSSSPSLNSVEHPIYDVWLLKCHNIKVDASQLLSSAQLDERDAIEKQGKQDLSKEAKIAIKAAKRQAQEEEEAKAAQAEQDKQKEAEKELQARQLEIEKEIQNSAQQAIIDNSDVEGDGPVSLLNIGKENLASDSVDTPDKQLIPESEIKEVIVETQEETSSEQVSSVATETTDGLVIIEDTHHETLEKLDIPEDIEEIIPQTQPLE